MPSPRTIGIVLFEGFELLDVFGPCEAYASRDLDGAFQLVMAAQQAGPIASAQRPRPRSPITPWLPLPISI